MEDCARSELPAQNIFFIGQTFDATLWGREHAQLDVSTPLPEKLRVRLVVPQPTNPSSAVEPQVTRGRFDLRARSAEQDAPEPLFLGVCHNDAHYAGWMRNRLAAHSFALVSGF